MAACVRGDICAQAFAVPVANTFVVVGVPVVSLRTVVDPPLLAVVVCALALVEFKLVACGAADTNTVAIHNRASIRSHIPFMGELINDAMVPSRL
jgi:hypothetical protein